MSRSARMAAPFLAALDRGGRTRGGRRRVLPERLGARDPWLRPHRGHRRSRHGRGPPEPARARVPRRADRARGVGRALVLCGRPAPQLPVLEAERGILYVAAAAATLLLLSSREASSALLGGVVAGAVLVSLYALGTRLFPGHVGGAYDPSSGYQLTEPIGYANALGLLTALAILLALGFAAHGAHLATRVARGGRARRSPAHALLLVQPRRARGAGRRCDRAGSCSTRAASVCSSRGSWSACPPRSACSRPRGRMRSPPDGATLQTAQAEGAHLTRVLVVLALAAAAAPVVLHLVERRLRLPQRPGAILVSRCRRNRGGRRRRRARRSRRAGHRGRTRLSTRSPSRPDGGGRPPAACSASRGPDAATTGTSPGRWLATNRCSARAPAASRRTGCRSAPSSSLSPPAMRTTSTSRRSPSSVRSGWRCSSPRSRSRSRRSPQARGLPFGPAAAGAFVAYLLHACSRLGLGDPRRDARRALLRRRSARLAAPDGLGSAHGQATRRGRSALAAPVLGVALVAHVGNRATAASIAAIERGEPGRCARPRAAGDRLGAVVTRALAASRRGRALRPEMTLRRAGAWHVRSS